MSSARILGDKDVNAAIDQTTQQTMAKDVKSMDYHRQVFHSKMAEEPYVVNSSPMEETAAVVSITALSMSASGRRYTLLSSSTPMHAVLDAHPIHNTTLLEYHLTNSNAPFSSQQYVSPSDNIMSPCSQKISALRNKQVSKYVPRSKSVISFRRRRFLTRLYRAKPKSLFAQASAKRLAGSDNPFGSAKSIPKA